MSPYIARVEDTDLIGFTEFSKIANRPGWCGCPRFWVVGSYIICFIYVWSLNHTWKSHEVWNTRKYCDNSDFTRTSERFHAKIVLSGCINITKFFKIFKNLKVDLTIQSSEKWEWFCAWWSLSQYYAGIPHIIIFQVTSECESVGIIVSYV